MHAATIEIRRPQYDFAALPRHYIDHNPLLSALFSALSLTFPEGERLFVHSVRLVRDQVKDPQLQQQIAGFIGQEAMHSQAHTRFNSQLAHLGLETTTILEEEQRLTQWSKKHLSAKQQLAITCALEHFTAILASYILAHPDLQQKIDPQARQLWLWHALEETEHKAVAFDVYQTVFQDQTMRRCIMAIISTTFITRISYLTLRLLWQDKQGRTQLTQHIQALTLLKQIIQDLLPEYLAYYRANFHPNQIETKALTQRWRTYFEQLGEALH